MPPGHITPQTFIAKWNRVTLSERSASPQHFLDLCELFGQPKPADVDPEGTSYTFERGARKSDGRQGWADVWKRDYFAWEYKRKGKHRSLSDAYQQLLLYRENLDNPPLLVVSDINHTEIHTNFTRTTKKVYHVDLEEIGDPDKFGLLRKVFTDPDALKPGQTTEAVTKEVADRFAHLADGIRRRQIPMQDAARFLMKLMFCMFAERVDLLPKGMFRNVLVNYRSNPSRLAGRLRNLFGTMATGGDFGEHSIQRFNGGLFVDTSVVELTPAEIQELIRVSECDWGSVEPSIFGTLLERTIDPDKRSQVGTHYTSREDILALLNPVLVAPLRQEWNEVRRRCEEIWVEIGKGVRRNQGVKRRKDSKQRREFDRLLLDFVQRLSSVTVLDAACGAGNFLYVAINLLLDLEKEVIAYAAHHGTSVLPHVSPKQLSGIEINPYARHLAQVVMWIGHLQWKHQNGFAPPRDPVLDPIDGIREGDAILDLSDPEQPKAPEWPEAEFIVGNPPFLGGKKMRAELGDVYMDRLFQVWSGCVKAEADLCCYWFEKARTLIESGKTRRAGLLATQGIRGGANRDVLNRIKETGGIFFAESDRPWIQGGVGVHVSMVGFDGGEETKKILDGRAVSSINANLTASLDMTAILRLRRNLGISFQGPVKVGSFELDDATALTFIETPNPHGAPNSDVVRPWSNGISITQRRDYMWIIDFRELSFSAASLYEGPMEYVRKYVKPERDRVRRQRRREFWWIHGEVNNAFRNAVADTKRYLATCQTAKHRLYAWFDTVVLPAQTVIAFARSDNFFAGVLYSRLHEVWALMQGTRLETRPRYTPTTCFETFPFPQPTAGQRIVIAEAAQQLDRLRNHWLNPPEWTRQEVLEFPGSVGGPWERYVQGADERGIGMVRFPRLVPKNEECARKLAARTLTNLYNQRPAWLDNAHRELDEAVFAAYDWKPSLNDEEVLEKLLELNLLATADQKRLRNDEPITDPEGVSEQDALFRR